MWPNWYMRSTMQTIVTLEERSHGDLSDVKMTLALLQEAGMAECTQACDLPHGTVVILDQTDSSLQPELALTRTKITHCPSPIRLCRKRVPSPVRPGTVTCGRARLLSRRKRSA